MNTSNFIKLKTMLAEASDKYKLNNITIASIYDYSFLKKNGILRISDYHHISENGREWYKYEIMEVKNTRTIQHVVTNFDLTICQIYYDGKNIYATHFDDILAKKGTLNDDYAKSFWSGNHFLKRRIFKYINRGYSIAIPFKDDFKLLSGQNNNIIRKSESESADFVNAKKIEEFIYINLFYKIFRITKENGSKTYYQEVPGSAEKVQGYDPYEYKNLAKLNRLSMEKQNKSIYHSIKEWMQGEPYDENEDFLDDDVAPDAIQYTDGMLNAYKYARDFLWDLRQKAKKISSDILIFSSKPYKGETKSGIDFFNDIFTPDFPHPTDKMADGSQKMVSPLLGTSFCPVCLASVNRDDGCMYVMGHNCSSLKEQIYNEKLFNKYKYNYYSKMMIEWCTICGRITKNHKHIVPQTVESTEPIEYSPFLPGAPEGNHMFYQNDCVNVGGGGLKEKIERFRRLRDEYEVLQSQVGIITVKEAKLLLIKKSFEAPLHMEIEKAQKILDDKTFNLDKSVYPDVLPKNIVVPVEKVYDDIPFPEDRVRPTKYDGDNEDKSCVIYASDDEGKKSNTLYQFHHEDEDGGDNHKDSIICKTDLLTIIKDNLVNYSGDKFSKCWFYPYCKAILYPEEIEAILIPEEEPAVPINAAVLEENQRNEELFENYKKRFNEKLGKEGGGKKEEEYDQIFRVATDASDECPIPETKRKNTTRKKNRNNVM